MCPNFTRIVSECTSAVEFALIVSVVVDVRIVVLSVVALVPVLVEPGVFVVVAPVTVRVYAALDHEIKRKKTTNKNVRIPHSGFHAER